MSEQQYILKEFSEMQAIPYKVELGDNIIYHGCDRETAQKHYNDLSGKGERVVHTYTNKRLIHFCQDKKGNALIGCMLGLLPEPVRLVALHVIDKCPVPQPMYDNALKQFPTFFKIKPEYARQHKG
jgi:hypothetical protein